MQAPPVDAEAQTQEEEQREGKGEKIEKEKAVEWGIFRLRECQAMVFYWIACGNVYMNMAQWAPTYFQDAFKITAAEAGAYLAAANFLHVSWSPLHLLRLHIFSCNLLHWVTLAVLPFCGYADTRQLSVRRGRVCTHFPF